VTVCGRRHAPPFFADLYCQPWNAVLTLKQYSIAEIIIVYEEYISTNRGNDAGDSAKCQRLIAPDQLFSGELFSGAARRNGETTLLKVMVWGILTAMMITTAAVAEEDGESAGFMLPYCKIAPAQAANKAFLVGRCSGMVQGIADALGLMKDASGERLNPLCAEKPKGTTTDQAVKAVVRYGDAHPEQAHAPFTVITVLALTEAWPCKK
jgi:hypothetical protein